MGKNTDILFELISIWAKENELYSKQGTVSSVDDGERTCIVSPTDGGPDILDVNFEADSGSSTSKGFYVVPSVGSLVIVTFLNKEDSFISAWTNIDKVIAKQGEWVFNDGANGGIAKTPELTDRFNNLENKVNELITYINSHVHTSAAPGSPTTSPVPLYTGGNLTPTVRSDIENEDVKH